MKIAAVEAIPIRLPRNRDQARSTAGSPTALADGAGPYRWSTTVPALYSIWFETALVKLTTTEGIVGWGEAQAPLAPEVACTIVETLLKPVLLEWEFRPDPDGIAEVWDRMYSTMRVRGQTSGFMLDAMSGVDIALWDLVGIARSIPVSRLLSEAPKDKVEAYLSGVAGANPAERAQTALMKWAEGFRTFKLFHESTVEELLATFDAICEVLPENPQIAVDALWRLEPVSAHLVAAELDRRRTLWLEAPFAPEDPLMHLELALRISTPLALGESYRTCFEMDPFFRTGAVGIAQPDIGRTGITGARRITRQAAQHNVSVVPHLSIALGPQIAAALHFAAATPQCTMLEQPECTLRRQPVSS